MKTQKTLWYLFFAANVAFILYYWWQGSSMLLLEGGLAGVLIAIGRITGIAAAFAIFLQFTFMGRTPWLERVFGLDRLARIHHTSGLWAIGLLIAHPVSITFGYALLSNNPPIKQFVELVTTFPHVIWAAVGFVLFISVVIASIHIVRKRLRYESWYFVHLLVYLAIFSSLWHQFANGGTIASSQVFYTYWVGLYFLVLANHVTFRFARPVYLYFKHRFYVARVVQENYNTTSVYIKGEKLHEFDIHPGQFMIFRFFTRGMWWQAHPFSLSFFPNQKELRITVKAVGDFTEKINQLPAGTKVMIDGPYGVFTDFFSVSKKALLIAGGIGITPIRSLMEEMLQKGKDVVLMYANKTRDDIVFKKEIEELQKKYPARVIHVLSDEEAQHTEHGYVDAEKIKHYAPDVSERDVYLCGPPPMMDAVVSTLEKLSVPRTQIHFERFSLQ